MGGTRQKSIFQGIMRARMVLRDAKRALPVPFTPYRLDTQSKILPVYISLFFIHKRRIEFFRRLCVDIENIALTKRPRVTFQNIFLQFKN